MPVQMDVEFDTTKKIVGYELELAHRGWIDTCDVRGQDNEEGEDGKTEGDKVCRDEKEKEMERRREAEDYALFMQHQVLINDRKETDVIDDQFDMAYYDQLVYGAMDQYIETDDDTDSFYDY